MTEQETADRISAVMSGFIGRVINVELYLDINTALSEFCDSVICDERNNTSEQRVRGNVRADVAVDGVRYISDIKGGKVAKP